MRVASVVHFHKKVSDPVKLLCNVCVYCAFVRARGSNVSFSGVLLNDDYPLCASVSLFSFYLFFVLFFFYGWYHHMFSLSSRFIDIFIFYSFIYRSFFSLTLYLFFLHDFFLVYHNHNDIYFSFLRNI